MCNDDLTAGVSLSHLTVRDTRVNTIIHEDYRTPLVFGADTKPAISALISMKSSDIHSYPELVELYSSAKQSVQDIKASVCVGTLRIIPTPWLFDILKIIQGISDRLLVDEPHKSTQPLKKEEIVVPKEEKKKLPWVPKIQADVKMDNPYIFIVEDTKDPHSSSLLLSLSVSASFAMSPLMDIDMAVSIQNIRGCRSHPCDIVIPAPSMTDALVPFDLNVNVHIKDSMQFIQAAVLTSHDIEVRVGILDVKLILNAMNNLIPEKVMKKESKPEEKKEEEVKEKESRSSIPTVIFRACLNALSVTVVNDTKEFELPVLQLDITDLSAALDMKPDLTTVEATLSVAADYYNAALTVWEPVLEKWSLQVSAEQEPRDRVVQKLTATQDSKLAAKLALTRVTIQAPTMLNVNVTNAFIRVALQTVSAFTDCRETTQKLGDGYYIGVRNSTGLTMNFAVKNDDGINALLAEQNKQKVEDHRDDAVWAGLADVDLITGRSTCWISLHRFSPHIRVYDAIPLTAKTQPIAWGDDCELREIEGVFCEVCQFTNQFLDKRAVSIFMENMDEVNKWRQAWKVTLQPVPEVESDDVHSRPVSMAHSSSVLVTSLPAHPSLSLKFLKQPYKKLQPRMLEITIDDYPPFSFQVDRVTASYVPLRALCLPARDIVVEAVVERGRKILSVASRVCVVNECECDVWCGFGRPVNESEIAYAEVTNEELHRGEKRWVKVDEVDECALFLSGSVELARCLPLQGLYTDGLHKTVNLGTKEQPQYVNLTVEKRSLPSVYNPDDLLSTYALVLTDMVHLENLLPVPIEYRVVNRLEECAEEGYVKEGGVIALSKCQFSKEEIFRVSVRVKDSDLPFPSFSDAMDVKMMKHF